MTERSSGCDYISCFQANSHVFAVRYHCQHLSYISQMDIKVEMSIKATGMKCMYSETECRALLGTDESRNKWSEIYLHILFSFLNIWIDFLCRSPNFELGWAVTSDLKAEDVPQMSALSSLLMQQWPLIGLPTILTAVNVLLGHNSLTLKGHLK